MKTNFKQILLAPLLILMLFPWTRITSGFDSDVQPYSFAYGIVVLFIFMLTYAIKPLWGLSKVEGYVVLAAIALFIEAFIIVIISDGPDALRGTYQYLNGATFLMLLFFVLKYQNHHRDSKLIYSIVFYGFVIWISTGFIQLVYNKTFLTSFVSRSVLTSDRGAISLSSEPGYFGYTLIFFSVFFLLYEKKRLAIISALLVPILTLSAASIASLAILCVIIITYRYGLRSLALIAMLAIAAYFTGDFLTRQPELADYRAVTLMRHLYEDRSKILLDGSLNIRLVHMYYSHLGFLESLGIPNGVTYWPTYLSERVGESSLLWDTGLNQTSRINSGMGGIIFEGGWLSLAVITLILMIIRESTENRKQFALFCAVFIYLFYIGFNFRTPFLYILLLVVLMRARPQCAAEDITKDKVATHLSDPSLPVARTIIANQST